MRASSLPLFLAILPAFTCVAQTPSPTNAAPISPPRCRNSGAPAELTIYPNAGHGKWDVTYGNPALYSWFLSQKK